MLDYTGPDRPLLTVDDRVGSAELVTHMPPGAAVELDRLAYGDACWMGNGPDGPVSCAAERKAAGDLVTCLRDGRLKGHQLPGMACHYDRLYLVIEGTLWSRSRPGEPLMVRLGAVELLASELDGQLLTMREAWGLGVLHTVNLRHTAQVLWQLYRWWQRPWAEHHPTAVYRPLTVQRSWLARPSTVQRVACVLGADIGEKRAVEVARAFPSVEAMCAATLDDWTAIKGIDTRIAERAIAALRGE